MRVARRRAVDGGTEAVIPARAAGAMRRALLRWYAEKGRDFPWRIERNNLYHLVVAEFLLQRTRAETVSAFFDVFMTRFPSWKALADASAEDIGKFLRPIGLWRRRSESLSALAKAIAARNGHFPSSREEIEQLPGVGQYIANAIMLFSAGHAEPLLDVNMARVLERLFGPRKLVDIRYDPYLQSLSRVVVRGEHAAELNWAILDLAAMVCTAKNPRCGECALRRNCRFANRSR